MTACFCTGECHKTGKCPNADAEHPVTNTPHNSREAFEKCLIPLAVLKSVWSDKFSPELNAQIEEALDALQAALAHKAEQWPAREQAKLLIEVHELRLQKRNFSRLCELLGFSVDRVIDADGDVDWSLLEDSLRTRDELIAIKPAEPSYPMKSIAYRNKHNSAIVYVGEKHDIAIEAATKSEEWEKVLITPFKPAEPSEGFAHCNHPMYCGTKCKNCGRVSEPAEPSEKVLREPAEYQMRESADQPWKACTKQEFILYGGYTSKPCELRKLYTLDALSNHAQPSDEKQEWLPIESAPKDGTRIWCWFPSGKAGAYPVSWRSNDYEPRKNWTLDDGESAVMHMDRPSKWLPLPAAPKEPA